MGRAHRREFLVVTWVVMAVLNATAGGRSRSQNVTNSVRVPALELDGGRRLVFETILSSEAEVRGKPGFWKKLANLAVGEAQRHPLVRPYSTVTDSHGRIIVSDPGASGVHIFDIAQHKYRFIQRSKDRDGLHAPQCVAVDSADNIYVTDSDSGKVFVFNADGKFERVIGSLKGGEGYFKRPTGIAVDSEAQRIYITDTFRDSIFVLDMQGSVLKTIGKRGTGEGEFNFPTELRLYGEELVVVDAMNFRVQVLDRSGNFRFQIGQLGEEQGNLFRPKGVAIDSEGHLYVAESLASMVQVFDQHGNLLYYFGQKGTGPEEFYLPSGVFIDRNDRIFVVDSFNRRVQVFHYFGPNSTAQGAQ